MNPKTLQYLMGHSTISVTINVYTHVNFDNAEEELHRMKEFRKAQAEIEKMMQKWYCRKCLKLCSIAFMAETLRGYWSVFSMEK